MAESFEGTCHCGAPRFVFTTAIPPSRWRVRARQCSFCQETEPQRIARRERGWTLVAGNV